VARHQVRSRVPDLCDVGYHPEGGATNVGELLLDRGKTKLYVTTELQSFGLIVTVEPYFAVTRPSDFVSWRASSEDMAGTVEEADAKYDLLPRGQYTWNANPAQQVESPRRSSKIPWDLYEARNAVRIARWAGAERYAPKPSGRRSRTWRMPRAI